MNVKVDDIACNKQCFARQLKYNRSACTLLKQSYKGDCPFQKDDPEYTNGKYYPFNTKKYGEPINL